MITTEQLIAHKHWLENHPNGQRLVLRDAVLRDAVLRGADLRGADLRDAVLRDAVLRGADLRGADLRDAVLRDAVLRGADLRDAVLRGADLRGADLRDAVLSGAVLSGADLRDAVLRDAVLSGAVLSGADLRDAVGLSIAADAPERLQAVARAALEPNALEMGEWHTCETTHCMAGWAVHLAGEPGRILESALGTEIAGLCLLGPEAHRYFFKGNDEAREFLDGVLTTTAEADRAEKGGGGVMAELSPAVQAVLDAFVDAACGSTHEMHRGLAAALRAAADQVECTDPDDNAFAAGYDTAIGDLLAIAAELEAANG